jgi:release factor glutamine methyltransferase
MAEQSWTIGSLLNWTAQHFANKGLLSPRLDAEVLLAHVLRCRRIELYTRSDEPATDNARSQFRTLVERRLGGCPVAYLVGRKEFFLLDFEVTPAVLIPRPATETLVVAAIERLNVLEAPRVLDLGTGSGCIAISLAVRLPSARIVAIDSSAGALDVARRNAATHGVSDRIEFRHGDLFAPVAGEEFAAVVSNPPYVPSAEIAKLAAEVRDLEPRSALDGGNDGLDVVRRLVAGAANYLMDGGWLIFEFGAGQEKSIVELVGQSGELWLEKVIVDGDGIPRVAVARRA